MKQTSQQNSFKGLYRTKKIPQKGIKQNGNTSTIPKTTDFYFSRTVRSTQQHSLPSTHYQDYDGRSPPMILRDGSGKYIWQYPIYYMNMEGSYTKTLSQHAMDQLTQSKYRREPVSSSSLYHQKTEEKKTTFKAIHTYEARMEAIIYKIK